MNDEVTKEFPEGKESYCPRCYFDDDKVILRDLCHHHLYRAEICRIISEMLDNPNEYGIYPTTKCYEDLQAFIVKEVKSVSSVAELLKD